MTAAHSPKRSTVAGPKPGGRGLLGRSVTLVLPGHRIGERPSSERPAIAILGRSNVGKSSLLNSLLGVTVARVSQTPGRTQALYWYRVDDRFDVVDCPGYGYAKTGQGNRERFSEMIDALLTGEPRLRAALLLVDGRLEPQESDRSMALFLQNADVPTVVAATKWDAVKPSQRVRQRRALATEYENPSRPLQPVSSETGENLPELTRVLLSRLRNTPGAPEPDPTGEPSAKETDHAPTQSPRR